MPRNKKKLTQEQRANKRRRRLETQIIFINGKQKRVPRERTIDGMSVSEFISHNADPIWLLEQGMYAELHAWEMRNNEAGWLTQERAIEPVRQYPTEPLLPEDSIPF